MDNKDLFVQFLMYVMKKLRYKKHIDDVIFYNIDINKKFYSFDLDVIENNGYYQSLHIDLLRNQIIKSNELIKKILFAL